LIMVLSFTGSLSVASAGGEAVRTVLIAAIGCNLAWGLVDAVMYILTSLTERGREASVLRRIREERQLSDAGSFVGELLSPELARAVSPRALTEIADRIRQSPVQPVKPTITGMDLWGALGVFLLVFLSTFPVVLPFLLSEDLFIAMRWSNGIAVAMMFVGGYSLGRYGGFSAIGTGFSMVALGVVLVALTIALGG